MFVVVLGVANVLAYLIRFLFQWRPCACIKKQKCCKIFLNHDTWSSLNRSMKLFWLVMLFMAQGLVVRSFRFWRCRDLGSLGKFVHEDLDIECITNPFDSASTFGSMAITCTVSAVVYGIFYPCAIILILFDKRRELKGENANKNISYIFGVHYNHFRESTCIYWDMFDLFIRLFCMGCILVVKPDNSIQLFLAVLTAFTFFFILVDVLPYERKLDNRLSMFSWGLFIITIIVGFALR